MNWICSTITKLVLLITLIANKNERGSKKLPLLANKQGYMNEHIERISTYKRISNIHKEKIFLLNCIIFFTHLYIYIYIVIQGMNLQTKKFKNYSCSDLKLENRLNHSKPNNRINKAIIIILGIAISSYISLIYTLSVKSQNSYVHNFI